jgi:hypothetical protein
MKTILLLSMFLMLTACAPGLPELKYADGSRRIPINPHPIRQPNNAPKKDPAAFATAAPSAMPQAPPSMAQATQTWTSAALDVPKPAPKVRCVRRKQSAAAGASQDSANFSKWLFPIVP